MKHHPKNPYLKELNHQKAQQAHYERGVRITGEQDHEYAHDLHNAITFFETEAAHWDYKNALTQNNLHPVLLPEHVTDVVFSHMEDISEYEGWDAKLTVTYAPTTQTLHCELCSVHDGEESSAVTYRFPIPGGQEPEYKVFAEPQEFTYQPEPDINNPVPNTAVFLPELSHPAANNRKKILRPQGLYLLCAAAKA